MQTNWRAILIVFGVLAGTAAAKIVPFDFTGHWSGTLMQSGGTGTVFADLSGTGTPFTGSIGVDLGGTFLTCTLAAGKQKRKILMPVTCTDGSHAVLKAKLDPTARTLTGSYHGRRPGHKGHHGTFTISNGGSCVPTGGDCTDPTTGGGESAVCCNGDRSLGGTAGAETHSCN